MNNWIVFDAMGVIFEVGDDTNDLLVPFIRQRRPQMEIPYIQSVYHKASLGQITAHEFWQMMGLGEEYPQIERTYLDTCLKIDAQFKPVAQELSRSYSLAILSNDIAEWSAYLRQQYGLDSLCREAIISGDVGLRKPAKEIYKILLDRIAVPANQCIFIDDRVPNLLAAAELGIISVWYQRNTEEDRQEIRHRIQCFTELPGIANKIFSYLLKK